MGQKPWYRADRQGAEGALTGSAVTSQLVTCSDNQMTKYGYFKVIMNENKIPIHCPVIVQMIWT